MEQDLTETYLKASDSSLLHAWYDGYMRQTVGIGPDEATAPFPEIRQAFEEWATGFELRTKICSEWSYCERRAALGEKATLLTTLADFVCGVTGIPTDGGLSAAMLLIRYGLDRYCRCE